MRFLQGLQKSITLKRVIVQRNSLHYGTSIAHTATSPAYTREVSNTNISSSPRHTSSIQFRGYGNYGSHSWVNAKVRAFSGSANADGTDIAEINQVRSIDMYESVLIV